MDLYMSDEKKTCDLCGLPVEVSGFQTMTKEGRKYFCCEGCLGIYQILNAENLLPDDATNRENQ